MLHFHLPSIFSFLYYVSLSKVGFSTQWTVKISMSRQPSTIASASYAGNNVGAQSLTPPTNSSATSAPNGSLPPRSDSLSTKLAMSSQEVETDFDLDEMFTKYTVSEVRAAQRQLRFVFPGSNPLDDRTERQSSERTQTLNKKSCALWLGA
jgi:hypothetical protein